LFIVTFAAGSYERMFDEFELNLPLFTMLFFWWRRIGLWLIVGAVAFGLFAAVTIRLRRGRAGWLRLVATIPLFGPLCRWSGFAEWASLLSVLIRNQIPLPEALRLSGDGLSNEHVGGISHWLADGAERGQAVWKLLSTSREAPNSLIPLLRWGEEKGMLAEAFGTGCQMLEARVRVRSLLLQSILPPILFIAIGCCVLFVVGALFAPLVNMLGNLS
jgi:general secretion pathway protein F